MISFRTAVLTMAVAAVVPGHSGMWSRVQSHHQSLPSVVTPIRSVDVATQIDGDVMEILIHEGDTVSAGQALARMDDRIPAAQVDVAQVVASHCAGVELAESELRQAHRMLGRMLAAQKRGAIADADVDRAIADRELAEARLQQAKEEQQQNQKQLQLEQARLSAYVLQAPFDGEVLRVEQMPGSAVAQGTPIIRIADVSRLKATVFMPFSWFTRVQPGTLVQLEASAPVDALIPATVVSTEPAIDAATETFRCVVEFDNTDRYLPSGFTVTVREHTLPPVAENQQKARY